jgi:7-cyano-7-deazaguanine synthase
MDSAVLLTQEKSLWQDPVALSFDYGQRHKKELRYAQEFASKLLVPHRVVDLSAIRPLIGQGSQTGDDPVPEGHYADENMKITVVPNRNMIMLSVAVGHAIAIGAKRVAFAAHRGDHDIYPDCRGTFVETLNEAVHLCDWSPPSISAPFISMSKADICRTGAALGVDFRLTWSCYKGEALHCGKCGTCVERKEAFQLANVPDPTEYSI